ncbi:hypothetical protein JAAARDRAFT_35986 [Jaapia argillacea MUCL 33604]|uniref:Guanine nucleotide-binding protein alpha-4 subunit n=1 Tax=Jaapia argillacea MUCL 33604 TaxID=933084 RepID=A0A067Q1H3_9AGAM|nr:hypothetical protein JAAARDRAFT_35986 [Jaapia argillacea MUCL 33604]
MVQSHRPPSSVYSADDPLTFFMRPPDSETEEERKIRIQQEEHAKRVSEAIDEEISKARERLKKSKGDVKLLLLGQAESGKSTLQKQFQIMYNPDSLDQERLSWRIVVYFNIVRSIRRILDTLDAYNDAFELNDNGNADGYNSNPVTVPSSPVDSSILLASLPTTNESARQIATLRLCLSPLVSAEQSLADRLSGGVSVSDSGKGRVYVRSGWQTRTLGLAKRLHRASISSRSSHESGSQSREDIERNTLVTEVASMLAGSKDHILELWVHPTVRKLIARRKLKLEECAEFFMADVMRVAEEGYVPTTDDILHARIQTMGVAEHTFSVDLHGSSVTWHLFDVGGARGQRHIWVPFFDDANAIIFVAPISAFDQYLEEDPKTNRIDDSLQLFTQICSDPLLKKVHLVLFLNKIDVLRSKLANGVQVTKYITSYAPRENEFEPVVNYFRAHFLQVHRKHNENKRVLYTHLTSVVDTKATQRIIANVRDSVFRGHLKSAALV